MAKSILYRGSDTSFTVTVKDENGDPVDINTLLGLIIVVYHPKNSTIISQYSLNSLVGYDPITVTNSAGGVVTCLLQADSTVNAILGDIFIEVKAKYTNNAYNGNDFEVIASGAYLATISDAVTKSITGY